MTSQSVSSDQSAYNVVSEGAALITFALRRVGDRLRIDTAAVEQNAPQLYAYSLYVTQVVNCVGLTKVGR